MLAPETFPGDSPEAAEVNPEEAEPEEEKPEIELIR
jgi:hypothetical protein